MITPIQALLPLIRIQGASKSLSEEVQVVMEAGGVACFSRMHNVMDRLRAILLAFRTRELGNGLKGNAGAMFLLLDEADSMRGSTSIVAKYEQALAKLLKLAAGTVDVSATNLLCFIDAVHRMRDAPSRFRVADIIAFDSDDPGYFGFSRFVPFEGKFFEKRLKAADRLTDDVVGLVRHALGKPGPGSCAMLCVVDRVHSHTPNNFQARKPPPAPPAAALPCACA